MNDDKRFLKLPYRLCVGVMLLNRDNNVFVGRRRNEAGPEHVNAAYSWQMPQGGIDEGEEPYPAALRELYEETSVRSVELVAEAPDWYSYDLPQEILRRSWRGRYRAGSPRQGFLSLPPRASQRLAATHDARAHHQHGAGDTGLGRL